MGEYSPNLNRVAPVPFITASNDEWQGALSQTKTKSPIWFPSLSCRSWRSRVVHAFASTAVNELRLRSIQTTPVAETAPIKCTFGPLAAGSRCTALIAARDRPLVRRQNRLKFVSSIQTICFPSAISLFNS